MANLNPAPAKPHTAGILSFLTSLLGFVALNSQTIAQYVPPKAAGAVLIGGIVAQAITKGVQHGDTDLVPKTN
jgi:hypothetical protein